MGSVGRDQKDHFPLPQERAAFVRPADAFGILFGDDKIVAERPVEFDGLHDEGVFAGTRCGSLQSLY